MLSLDISQQPIKYLYTTWSPFSMSLVRVVKNLVIAREQLNGYISALFGKKRLYSLVK